MGGLSGAFPPLLLKDIAVMARAYEAHTEAMKAYSDACSVWDWVTAEEARIRAIASLEAFLDAVAAGHKFVESAKDDPEEYAPA